MARDLRPMTARREDLDLAPIFDYPVSEMRGPVSGSLGPRTAPSSSGAAIGTTCSSGSRI